MNSIQTLVKDVEAAVAGHDEMRRVRMLRSVTDLFFSQAERLGDDHMQVFDEVIVRLAQEIDRLARVDLSRKLADAPKAPRKTVRNLALDPDIEVAAPILERSRLLAPEDLMIVISERTSEHLLAIARRTDLDTVVTDALIQRGDGRVHGVLLRNRSAQFSSFGMRRLSRETPAEPAVETHPEQRRRRTPDEMALAVGQAAEQIRGLAAAGRLDEAAVLTMLEEGRTAEALAGVALLSEMPTTVVLRAFGAAQPDPLMFIARALGFGWPTLRALLDAKTVIGEAPDMAAIRSSFELLTVATAQRVLRFVSLRARQEKPVALSA